MENEMQTFVFTIDGDICTTRGYETKRDDAISLEDLWNEFQIARRIISGFSFTPDGDMEFAYNYERKLLLEQWIAIGRPKPFPGGAST
jgi:hypothetical protein